MDYLEHLLKQEREIAQKAIAKVKKLEERLQNAFVPKFKVGQKVWYIGDRGQGDCVLSFVIDEISISVDGQGYHIFYEEHGYLGIAEGVLFTTQAEAEKALAERGAK